MAELLALPAQMVVLQTKTAKAATLDILTTHCISSAVSDNLKSKENTLEEVESTTDELKSRDESLEEVQAKSAVPKTKVNI